MDKMVEMFTETLKNKFGLNVGYGVIDGSGIKILDEQNFLSKVSDCYKGIGNDTVMNPPKSKNKEFYKEYKVYHNGEYREITIAIVVVENYVKAGYSVLHPTDVKVNELSKKIALGRALNDKTNLFNKKGETYFISNEFVSNNVLKSISDNVIRDIEKGKIKIKGIREV